VRVVPGNKTTHSRPHRFGRGSAHQSKKLSVEDRTHANLPGMRSLDLRLQFGQLVRAIGSSGRGREVANDAIFRPVTQVQSRDRIHGRSAAPR
jgi:hypothetical protein